MPAAVLFPIVCRIDEPTVLLTQRTAHLKDHPGQISFPGGRCESADPSPAHTALRETFEEIGLTREHVELVGYLPEYRTDGFSRHAGSGNGDPALRPAARRLRGGRGFRSRSAFVVPDGSRQSPAALAALPRQTSPLLRHALRRLLHLGRDGGHHHVSLPGSPDRALQASAG